MESGMKHHPLAFEAKLGSSVFEKSCAYCGAKFRVVLSHHAGGDRHEDYGCPECGKRYEVDAGVEPEVRLVGPRTDGKDDRYQETMF
jgi:uncharacterized Zn-finger protein